jgi:hypothetical protein
MQKSLATNLVQVAVTRLFAHKQMTAKVLHPDTEGFRAFEESLVWLILLFRYVGFS